MIGGGGGGGLYYMIFRTSTVLLLSSCLGYFTEQILAMDELKNPEMPDFDIEEYGNALLAGSWL